MVRRNTSNREQTTNTTQTAAAVLSTEPIANKKRFIFKINRDYRKHQPFHRQQCRTNRYILPGPWCRYHFRPLLLTIPMGVAPPGGGEILSHFGMLKHLNPFTTGKIIQHKFQVVWLQNRGDTAVFDAGWCHNLLRRKKKKNTPRANGQPFTGIC